jgi:hypothetical protein
MKVTDVTFTQQMGHRDSSLLYTINSKAYGYFGIETAVALELL